MAIDPFAPPSMYFDPFQQRGPTANLFSPLPSVSRPEPAVPPITPQEENSLFSQIGSGALHGLGWVGGVLDKTFGGRAIRGGLGALTGKGTPLSELLSFIPGSDMLGITNAENSISGAELLGGDKDTPLLSGQGLGGAALELALDPSTYLTLGGSALTGLGKTAAKAGIKLPTGAARAAGVVGPEAEKLARFMTLGEKAGPIAPKAIAEVAGKSLGGHLGVGLPFMDNLATFDLSGPLGAIGNAAGAIPGASLVNKAVNKVGELVDPLKRGFNSLFEAETKGQIDPVLQPLARRVAGETPQALYDARGKLAPLVEQMQRLAGWQGGPLDDAMKAKVNEYGKQLAYALERTPSKVDEKTLALAAAGDADAIARVKELTDTAAMHAPALAGVDPTIREMAVRAREIYDDVLQARRDAGEMVEPLKKAGVAGPEYLHRSGVQFAEGQRAGGKTSQLAFDEGKARKDLLKNLMQEGEGSVNWLTGTDEGKLIQQMAPQDAKQEILKKMFGWSTKEVDEFVALSNKSMTSMSDADHARYAELVKAVQPYAASADSDLFHIFSYKNPKNSVQEAINALQGGAMRPIDTWSTSAQHGKAADRWAANAAPGTVSFVYDRPTLESFGTGPQHQQTALGALNLKNTIVDRQGIAKVTNLNPPKMDPALSAIVYKGPQNTPEFAKLQQEVAAFNQKRAQYGLPPVDIVGDADVLGTITPTHSNIQAGEYATLQKKIANTLTQQEAERFKQLQAIQEQAQGLTDWQRKLDLDALQQTGGFFGNHPLADMEKYLENRAVNRLNAGAAFDAVRQMARMPGPGESGVPVLKLMDQLGLDYNKLDPALRSMIVPDEQAQALAGWIKPSVAPQGAQPWLGLMDSITNLTKAGQTSWPATQMRNVISDVFNRFAYGGAPIDPLFEAKAMREGRPIAGLAAKLGWEGISDADATQAVAREMYQLGLMDTKKFQAMDVPGVNPLLETTAKGMPTIGVPPKGLGETLQSHVPTTLEQFNPLETRGVGGRAESKFFPVGAMQSTQNYAEEMNRVATYLDARRRGYSPLAAMEQVTKAHLDFSNLAPFEKNVMRRVVPFYSWSRQNLPNMVREISTNPGGRMAQTMRTLNAATDQGFMPETVSQTGYAVPVGQDDRGRQNYLTSLGLPFEDLANLTSFRNLMGSTSPFVRLPYELATGRQVFTGQNVPANFPFEGDPRINALLMNSPLSRIFTTWRAANRGVESGQYWPTATQILAGPRITNVDPASARRAAVRQLADERLGSLPEISRFERLSVRPGQVPNLTPQELQLLQLYQSVNRR